MLQRIRAASFRKLLESEQSVAVWFRTLSGQNTLGDAPRRHACSFAQQATNSDRSIQASLSRFRNVFEPHGWPGFRGKFHTSPLSLSSQSEEEEIDAAVSKLIKEYRQCMNDGQVDMYVLQPGSSVTMLNAQVRNMQPPLDRKS